jgi:tRNA dimethylallyltransferase
VRDEDRRVKTELPEKIIVIQGATASGKTDLAVRLAEEIGGEIVNADSMQVYRGMDVGTAKPSRELRERVPHHLVDVVDPDEPFSAADFLEQADRAIAEIRGRGRNVVVVGGTGLYIRALLGGLVDAPSGDVELRKSLDEELRTKGLDGMLAELAKVDPETAALLHVNDGVRIPRALEVWRLTGVPVSRLRRQHAFLEDRYSALKIGISVGRDELYRRIDLRVDRMIKEGLVAEVESLLSEGYSRDLKSMRSLGYREIAAFLAGEMPLDEAVSLVKRDTRRYAKRQATWFNKDFAIQWFDYPANFATICTCVMRFLR